MVCLKNKPNLNQIKFNSVWLLSQSLVWLRLSWVMAHRAGSTTLRKVTTFAILNYASLTFLHFLFWLFNFKLKIPYISPLKFLFPLTLYTFFFTFISTIFIPLSFVNTPFSFTQIDNKKKMVHRTLVHQRKRQRVWKK